MRIYISGPITGMQDLNYFGFKMMELFLKSKGHTPINPHVIGKAVQSKIKKPLWADYMKTCIQYLMMADAIIMLPGWWKSRGALVELAAAMIVGIPRVKEKILV